MIIGAGIGGLTTAIALRRVGIEPLVCERAAQLRPAGAGLTLAANAGLVLHALGLLEAVRRCGAEITTGEARDRQGRVLQQVDLATIGRELGAPMIGLRRTDLQAVLLDALGSEVVQLGTELVGFRQERDRIVARFASGLEEAADLLVGADGLHSVVRGQLHGDVPPVYSGYTSWRGLVETSAPELAAGVSVETWGCGRRFGMVPIGPGRTYWFATENAPPGTDVTAVPALVARFGDWHAPIAQLLAATEPEKLIQTDIVDRPPLPRWGEGRVTLLGDAAHPMTPNLGQGACQAIEDALILAGCLQGDDRIPAALREYERLRRSRTGQITLLSRRFGRLGQLEGSLRCRLRDILLRATPDRLAAGQTRRVLQPDPAVARLLADQFAAG